MYNESFGGELVPLDIRLILFTVLSAFGIFYLFQTIASTFFTKNVHVEPEFVVIVKNYQDKIEGLVRSFYRRHHLKSNELFVVDRGSQDETPEILKRLSAEYEGLKVLLLPDVSVGDCIRETVKSIKNPLMLVIDTTKIQETNSDSFIDAICDMSK